MIKVENLSYSYPQKDLYNNISFTLEDGQHCALIGTSGTGKSTLADIIMNSEDYMFDGKIEKDINCRIGYVSQFPNIEETKEITVFQYIAEKFIKLESEIAEICTEMESSTEMELVFEKYQNALDAFDSIGGNDFESNINKKLNIANLGKYKDLNISELSGGEFKLVQVIKEMLVNPDLIIMDEPDVFLDFEKLISLKNLINSHKGIMLVITHNKYLLNHCFNKIIHLENMELQEFDGRYIDYNFSLLQRKIELQELALADIEEMERNEVLIERLRDIATFNTEASRGKALNARVKIQERLEARRVKEPFVDIKQPDIELVTDKEEIEKDTAILKVNNFKVEFEEVLLEDVNFEINANEKVAIIGPNGTGKTTLLREIYKNSNPAIELDENVEVSYFSQIQGETLDESKTVLEECFDSGFNTNGEIISHLQKYGFDEEIVSQKIGNLSGGEKNILQLAILSASNANLLLLDEPTSHLDTYSQIALEQAIEAYNGAILMISHDYYSIVNCMDYVLLIENKTIRKMSMRKFRKMIYDNHFNKDYLELEQKKKNLETRIAVSLKEKDFALAKVLAEELEELIKLF